MGFKLLDRAPAWAPWHPKRAHQTEPMGALPPDFTDPRPGSALATRSGLWRAGAAAAPTRTPFGSMVVVRNAGRQFRPTPRPIHGLKPMRPAMHRPSACANDPNADPIVGTRTPDATPSPSRNYFFARFAAFFCFGLCLAGFLVCFRAFCDLAIKVNSPGNLTAPGDDVGGARLLETDLFLGDFPESDVLGSKLLQGFHQGAVALLELLDPPGDHIDQHIRVIDDEERALQVIVSHGGRAAELSE